MKDKSIIVNNYINYINKVVENNKLSHAYLIEVNNYEEDLKLIYDFIKMILCNVSYLELDTCNNPIINQIDSNNYPDIYIVSTDTNTIKKEQLLNLQKEFSNKSLLNNKKIYIIYNAEKLNSSSANTILKFLEEPEDDIIGFLLTDNRYHIIDTIISRCQLLSLKDNSLYIDSDDELIDFLDCVLNPRNFFIKYNYYINNVIVDKDVAKKYFYDIEYLIIEYLNNKDNKSVYYDLLSSKSNSYLINIISIIEEEIVKFEFNVNYKLWLDSLFSRLIGG